METIKEEENEDDNEVEICDNVYEALGETSLPMPLDGEIHLRRRALTSPQGSVMTSSFSSVTDDSYMSFDSFSHSRSTRESLKNRPWTGGKARPWKGQSLFIRNASSGSSDLSLENRSLISPFDDDASQFTFESSNVSFGDSVCSYDSFSSESVKNMVNTLKQEAERRRSKIHERIALIRAQTDSITDIS